MSNKIFVKIFVLFTTISVSCQKIQKGENLSTNTISLIKRLKLLDDDERIVYFYSNSRENEAGNFFTDRRIAHYWLYGGSEKRDTTFVFYKDIKSIDTVYVAPGDFNAPYMEVTSDKGKKFRVYVEGSKEKKKMFFESALELLLLVGQNIESLRIVDHSYGDQHLSKRSD